jgi:hypothetical protein
VKLTHARAFERGAEQRARFFARVVTTQNVVQEKVA